MKYLIGFIRFCRPHTIIGTTLSISSLFAIAYRQVPQEEIPLELWFLTLISCLGANIYIVGLNQLTDIEIDKINKPFLPLAAGLFSVQTGQIIIAFSLIASLLIAHWYGGYLLATVLLSLFLGTIYSLPPMRLKRFYFWAAFCIIAVRGLIVNILLFLHFQTILGGPETIPPVIWLLTLIIFVYSIIIAWFKDIPDMEGDRAYGIRTLSLQLGARQVFNYGNALLGGFFVSVIVFAISSTSLSYPLFIALSHAFFLVLMLLKSRTTDLRRTSSVRQYYLFIWVLFFMEYVVFGIGG